MIVDHHESHAHELPLIAQGGKLHACSTLRAPYRPEAPRNAEIPAIRAYLTSGWRPNRIDAARFRTGAHPGAPPVRKRRPRPYGGYGGAAVGPDHETGPWGRAMRPGAGVSSRRR
ncbi:hypothetical protein TPA0910_53280 [Streptomyces hygroscopicus subsp. sporocinereus]|uniref:Uncharacterized protein n=1 Tax=Streptomyces hygroscopicus TaxID=1912 RepID=A0ABQ3U5M0_STRHY|nr:hypothetical protein TPA0910_53280 [Streptomyces hygroscopicus]